jgi:hypothetical protein
LAEFTPLKTANLGQYDFIVICNDTDTEVYINFQIKVMNNIPSQPEVTISPVYPKTDNDLKVKVTNIMDIETPLNKLEVWYHWFVNDKYQSEFDNLSEIPQSFTLKDETWRCEVAIFDGDDLGQFGDTSVIILNSAPILIDPTTKYDMLEDTILLLEKKLVEIFSDIDNDILTFSSSGQNFVDIEITQENGTIKLTPAHNWFGKEFITLYANDSIAQAETTFELTVKPVNDLPEIIKVGNKLTTKDHLELEFLVKQNEWLNR